jgi:hypothetical protein
METRFGEYHSQRGARYTYHLRFELVSGGVKWRAVVRNESGAMVATPQGVVRATGVGTVDDAVRGEVQKGSSRTTRPPALRRRVAT